VPQVQTFSGRTAAYQTADVRPQVSGVIDEVLFREGSNVKKGQPLYRINTDNYTTSVASGQAAVAQAQANRQTAIANNANAKAELASRQASLAQAINDFQRLKGLVEIDAISKQQYDQAQTQVRTAQAALESARAAVGQTEASIRSAEAGIKTAQSNLDASALDLNRTIVRAPLTGRSDRSSVTAGTLVNASQSEPLVTISRLDPIYVDISQSSSELLQLRQQIAEGKAQAGMNSVELVLEDGSVYPVRGKLALSEAKVDQSTGAVTLRAIFPNPNNVLLPGMYVSARLTQSVIPNAALVPQSAVMRTPKGDSQVYIVDENNQIQVRPVTINGTYDGQWVVTDGLSSGDKLVVIGGSKVKPEQEVVVKPLENANGASATPTAKTPQQAAKTVADDTSEQDTATTTN
jgi:membrane fusion protein (multidrug efflux system)